MEQYSRRETIRISGLPEEDEEKSAEVSAKVVQLFQDKLGEHDFDKLDISTCHRVGKKSDGKTRQVLVKLISRQKKQSIMDKKKKLKEKNVKVFLNDDLTQARMKIFHIAKEAKEVKYAYTRGGQTVCCLQDGNRFITLESPDDLFKIGGTEEQFREVMNVMKRTTHGQ